MDEFKEVVNKKIFSSVKSEIRTSFGLVVYTIKNNDIYYIAGRVRDTIAYKEFLRGKLTGEEEKYIKLLTSIEKNRLLTQPFDDLWEDLFVNKFSKIYLYERRKAKCIFEKNIVKFKDKLLEQSDEDAPLIFMKGHSERFESPINTAKREWEEESGINKKLLTIHDTNPVEEIYTGYDGNTYKTIYYLAYIDCSLFTKEKRRIKYINTQFRSSISAEISHLTVLQYTDLYKLLNDSKKNVLRLFNTFLLFNTERSSITRSQSE